jgi:serine O-acetyltransferase
MVGIPAKPVPVDAGDYQKSFLPYGTPCSQKFDPETQKLELLRCEVETLRARLDALTEEARRLAANG